MEKTLRLLIVEDSPDDTLLICDQIQRAGYTVRHTRVENERDMANQLATSTWDVVLSDYTLPSFNALAALEVLKKTNLDIPFIIVSGSIGEETAVRAMKAGAHDYIMKHSLPRLVPAIEREIRDAIVRNDRRQTIDALRKSEDQYRRIVNTSQEGIWILDSFANITFANQRVQTMLQYSEQELLGRSIYAFVERSSREEATAYFARIIRGERLHLDMQFVRRDGSVLWTLLSAAPLSTAENGGGALCMITDITKRKKAEQALAAAYDDLEERIQERTADLQYALEQLHGALEREKELNELKTRFVSMVSHEFRTPLTSILSSTEIMSRYRDRLEPERQERLLHVITESVQHMIDLLEDILVFGRAEANKLQFEPMPIDPHMLCREIVEEVSSSTDERHVIRLKAVEVPGQVCIDVKLLRHILTNLLTNAVKYSPDGCAVDCTLEFEGNSLVVSVSDRGIGMSREDMDHLYEPFYRARSVDTIPGTGLGLAIVKQSVDRHGGTIDVQSELGKGTTFTVVLPVGSPK